MVGVGKGCTYWLHALTSVHVGTGRGEGYIDLPIMREKITNYPIISGSSIKGVTRDYWANDLDDKSLSDLLRVAFGSRGPENANAGALVFTDARIVCLPIRSYFGTFAYVTSPFVLERLKRDLKTISKDAEIHEIGQLNLEEAQVVPNTILKKNDKVYFEDLDLMAAETQETQNLAQLIGGQVFSEDETWQKLFEKRFAIVSDDVFAYLCEMGTEVITRASLHKEQKTVQGMWYEEYLPAESILTGYVWCDKLYGTPNSENPDFIEDLTQKFCPVGGLYLQIGGNTTTGKGRMRCVFRR